MQIAAQSEIGNIRKENEDRYFISADKKTIAIADGMGGHENGKIAAYIAIETFAQYQSEIAKADFSTEKFAQIMKAVNKEVYDYKQNEASGKMMGTTFSSIVIKNTKLFLAHIGDSRVYLYRGGTITQLTEEHSYLAELLRNGKNPEEMPNIEKNKHILTRAIGPEATVEGQISTFSLESGDLLLLCTDGLHNNISNEEFADILSKKETLDETVRELVDLAMARGGNDNITLVLALYEQEADK